MRRIISSDILYHNYKKQCGEGRWFLYRHVGCNQRVKRASGEESHFGIQLLLDMDGYLGFINICLILAYKSRLL
jgi:hypothetical protein